MSFKINQINKLSIAMAVFFGGSTVLQAAVIEEVIVTAQKREQSLSDVGISISAFNEDAINKLGLGDIELLAAAVPNLGSLDAAAGLPSFRIRGQGLNEFQANFDSPVAVHRDEVFLAKPFLMSMGFFDVGRIEVLKGPQGTVFGRNTTGGAVNVYSAQPTEEFEGGAKLSYGKYQQLETEGYVSGSLSDNVRGRLAVQVIDHGDGPYTNLFDGRTDVGAYEQQQVRGILNWGNDATDVTLTAHYASKDGDLVPYDNLFQDIPGGVQAGGTTDLGAVIREPFGRFTINQNHNPTTDSETVGLSLRVEHDLGAGQLTSLTSFENFERNNREDSDNTPLDTVNIDWFSELDTFSQELRYAGESGNWNYLFGAYYENDELDTVVRANGSDFIGLQLGRDDISETESYAIFTNHEFALSDKLSAIFGVRYTEEKNSIVGDTYAALPTALAPEPKNIIAVSDRFDIPGVFGGPAVNASRTDDDLNFKLGLNYKPDDESLVYASVSTGFRSGGYDSAFGSPTLEPFDPEEATSFELGYKTSALDGALQFNAAVFYTEVDDYQSSVNFENELVPRRRNIGQLETVGLEADALWQPNDAWRVQLAAGYVDAEIAEVNNGSNGLPFSVEGIPLLGNEPVNTPELSFGAIVGYTQPVNEKMNLELLANYSWNDERFLEIQNDADHLVSSYDTLDLRVSLLSVDDTWSVSLWGKNVTDEEYLRYINDVPTFGLFLTINADPRTYGASFEYKF